METTSANIEVGSKVTWCHRSRSGKTISFATREGKCIAVDGEIATVKMRNGHSKRIHVSRLRNASQQTELSEAFDGARYE